MVLMPGGRATLRTEVGYTRMMLPAAILMRFPSTPIFLLITFHPSLPTLLAGTHLGCTLASPPISPAWPAVMASIFPRAPGSPDFRLAITWGSLSSAVSRRHLHLADGLTHNNTAPSFYLIAMGLISIAAVVSVKRHKPGYLRQREGKHIVALFGAQLAMPAGCDHDILFAL